MRQPFISVVSLMAFLYAIWAFSVFAEPPFPDMSEWQKTDFSLHSVPLEEMIEGGPGKDGIQSIDDPEFESMSDADELILAVAILLLLASGLERLPYF